MNIFFNKHKIGKYIIFFLSLFIIIIFLFRLTTTFDENYTLSLIQHSYKKIFYIDTVDVHPPLYYLLLKLYLSIFTFWTKSFLLKIVFARIFSVLLFIFTFIVLYKCLYMIHITKLEWYIQFILFLILPNVSGFNAMNNEQLIDIRMYSLSALIISLIFYFIIKYESYHQSLFIIVITILSIIVAYINYYAALISGLILLFNFIKYFIKKDSKYCLSFFISGLLLGLSYVPWIPIIIHQIHATTSIFYETSYDLLKQSLIFIAFISLFGYPVICYSKYSKNKKFKDILFQIIYVLLISFTLMLIGSIISHPMFRFRYLYPILIIFEFISINIIVIQLKYTHTHVIYTIIILLFLISGSFVSVYHQSFSVDEQSITIIHNCISWNHSNNEYIHLSPKNNKINGSTQTNINTEYAMYLTSINKRIICKGLKIPNKRDYLPLYNNIIKHVNN